MAIINVSKMITKFSLTNNYFLKSLVRLVLNGKDSADKNSRSWSHIGPKSDSVNEFLVHTNSAQVNVLHQPQGFNPGINVKADILDILNLLGCGVVCDHEEILLVFLLLICKLP